MIRIDSPTDLVFTRLIFLTLLVAPAGFGAELPENCMPLSEIRQGMVGEGRSVIKGFKLESFRVEILGVEQGGLPGSSMILAILEGDKLESHGIVAGMSGSPVYIDGKIIGAVAYGWRFSQNPVAGITPIEDMLAIWDAGSSNAPGRTSQGSGRAGRLGASPPTGPAGSGGANNSFGGWDWMPQWEAYANPAGAGSTPEPLILYPTSPQVIDLSGGRPLEMIPLSAPLYISAVSPATLARLRPFMSARGLTLMNAGSSAGSNGRPTNPSPPLQAGSGIGIPIVTGDISMGSIGTVTYRQGDRILAFGHPAFSSGASDMPMAHAYIFDYMESYQWSFKLGETREIIGTIDQDRHFGIGGRIGPAPPRVPMVVNVSGEATFRPRAYHYSIWEDDIFLPQMAALLALPESYAASVASSGEQTVQCRYRIRLAGGRTIDKTLHNSSPRSSGATFLFSLSMLRDMFLLTDNPFGKVDFDSIEVDYSVQPGYGSETLRQVSPRYRSLKAGDTLELEMIWQPYRGLQYERTVRLEIPEDLAPGPYVVHVADSRVAQRIDQRHEPARFRPQNLSQTIDLAQRLDYPSNRLKVYLFRPSVDVALRSDSMQGLPPSIGGLIAATAPRDLQSPVTGALIATKELDFVFPVTARASFPIEIVKYLAK